MTLAEKHRKNLVAARKRARDFRWKYLYGACSVCCRYCKYCEPFEDTLIGSGWCCVHPDRVKGVEDLDDPEIMSTRCVDPECVCDAWKHCAEED